MAWRDLFVLRFKPGVDLVAVGVSWLLVVSALVIATFVVTADNGVAYFLVYAVIGAAGFGVALPVWWMVWHRKRSIAELGVTTHLLGVSLGIQLVLAALQYTQTLGRMSLPDGETLLPLVTLALTIGLFEAIFWRGWVLLRLEDAFGFLPALLAGSALYALYHIGYGMGWEEMWFLFFVGIAYGAIFRITKNVFILWPLLQPMGQLTTLIKDGLTLPTIAALGFAEALIVIVVVLGIAWKYAQRRSKTQVTAQHLPSLPAVH